MCSLLLGRINTGIYSEFYSKYVVKEIDIDYVPLKIQTVLFILGAAVLNEIHDVGNSKLIPPQ